MNIFTTSPDPVLCAEALDDLRLNKMIVETGQLLSNALGGPYALTHYNHPCSKWVRDIPANLFWTRQLLQAMVVERSLRFPSRAQHLTWLRLARATLAIPEAPPPQDWADCSNSLGPTIFLRYQQCLKAKWAADLRPPRWTFRNPPEWSLPCSPSSQL